MDILSRLNSIIAEDIDPDAYFKDADKRTRAAAKSAVVYERGILTTNGKVHYKLVRHDNWQAFYAADITRYSEPLGDLHYADTGDAAVDEIDKYWKRFLGTINEFWQGMDYEGFIGLVASLNNLPPCINANQLVAAKHSPVSLDDDDPFSDTEDEPRSRAHKLKAPSLYFNQWVDGVRRIINTEPMFILYKNGKPYLQLAGMYGNNANGGIGDMEGGYITKVGAATAKVLREILPMVSNTTKNVDKDKRVGTYESLQNVIERKLGMWPRNRN